MSFEYIFKSDPPKDIQGCCARVDSLEERLTKLEGISVDNTDPLNPIISTISPVGSESFIGLTDTPVNIRRK